MDAKTNQFLQLPQRINHLLDNSTQISIGDVYKERFGSYIHEEQLFLAHFNTVPNAYYLDYKVRSMKAIEWLHTNYQTELKELHFRCRGWNQKEKTHLDDLYYILFEDLLVCFDISNGLVKLLFRETPMDKVLEIKTGFAKWKRRKEPHRPEISLLVSSLNGFETSSMKIKKPKLRLEDNYNDDFLAVHQTIVKRLSKNNDKGLVLLHGKPGTGKTSYIRHLITTVKKDVIFLPPNLASSITNPALLPILIENPNSIFVIEDAENIIIDRERNGNSSVSAILNITDGLLSDCLNVQIVCSFNTDLSRIDSALMRKGRLIAKYEFKELEVAKANALSRKLGFESVIHSPMTLTAIYNQDERDFQQSPPRNAIGFRTAQIN